MTEGLLLHPSFPCVDCDMYGRICGCKKLDKWIEQHKQVVSQTPSILNELNGKLREITVGDFDDGIQDAIDEAEKKMFELLVSPSTKLPQGVHPALQPVKDLDKKKALLEGSASHHGLKCYNTKCWNQDKTKNECRQYYYNIDKCPEWKKEGSAPTSKETKQ